jgi:hypothetical protein
LNLREVFNFYIKELSLPALINKKLFMFYLANFNMLWISALAIGIVIIVGFLMVSKRKKKEPVPTLYKAIHGIGTIIGASIVVIAAFMGDTRLWTNIILATIIVVLGLIMSFGKLTKSSAIKILNLHMIIAITCYVIFLYYIFI